MIKRFTGLGRASLLCALLVLCMTTLSMLCLSSARASERLSVSYGESVKAYYDAEYKANEILASLLSIETPEGVTESGGVYSYTCRISEDRVLAVEVKITGESYEILKWQAVNESEWETDNSLPVWDGE